MIEPGSDPVENDVGPFTDGRVGQVESGGEPVSGQPHVVGDFGNPVAELGQTILGRGVAGEQRPCVGVGLQRTDRRHQLGWHDPRHR